MGKWILFCVTVFLLGCTSENTNKDVQSCYAKFSAGSSLVLCDMFGNPMEDYSFTKDMIYRGEALCKKDKSVFYIHDMNIFFSNNEINLRDLYITVVNDRINWIRSDSFHTNFFFANMDYSTDHDSIYHFRFYGEIVQPDDSIQNFFRYSMYDKMIRINSNIEIYIDKKNVINN